MTEIPSAGAAYAAYVAFDGDPSDRAAVRRHLAFVRQFMPADIRGRKVESLSTRELAWISGVSVRQVARMLSRRRTVPNGTVRRPVPKSQILKLASRLPAESVARALIEQAADAWESERPAGELGTLPAGRKSDALEGAP